MPKLTRDALGLNGIEFFEEISAWEPKSHIAMLKEGLLDFVAIIPRLGPQHLDKYEEIPSDAQVSIANSQMQRRLKRARKLVHEAKRYNLEEEDGCDRLIQNVLFSKWYEAARNTPFLNLSDLSGAIAAHGGRIGWTQGHKARQLQYKNSLTRPTPDIYFAIRINSCEKQPKGFLRHKIHRNFTIESLSVKEGLIYSPSAGPKAVAREKKHQVCFPFAVVETKHEKVNSSLIIHCYCQAANASSTALSMLCQLSKYVEGTRYWWGQNNEVLPVVSFTFIGPCVKLWLSHVSNYGCGNMQDKTLGRDAHQYEMRCIWNGNILKLWDAIQLVTILDHLEYWFLQVYRPWVSGCLDLWNYQSKLKIRKKEYQEEMNRRTELEESAFRGHEMRHSDSPLSNSEAATSNSEEGFDRKSAEDYDDERSSVGDCFSEREEPGEHESSSTDDDTGSDEDGHDTREPTITVDGPEDLRDEIEDLRNKATAAFSSDDEGPISGRTRSRTNSAEPLSDSKRAPRSPDKGGQSTLSPERGRTTSARPNTRHFVSSPLESGIPVRLKESRRQSTLL
ncbi:hypothetical protein MMC18_006632 [Xylographa bjoerkii]|nr:hypothetical protein [Xylographa bjoerkii]